MTRRFRKKSLFVFCGIILFAFFLAGCKEKGPEIESIDPRIGRKGDVLTIKGSGFGDERNESFITVAGTSPTSSSYLSWKDTEIQVRISEFSEAGLVYVHRGRNKSNPALFADQNTLPVPAQSTETGNNPWIGSIEPVSGPIGSLITIQGGNFGSSRELSGVFFAWDADAYPGAPAGYHTPDFVEAFEAEFGYELWNEREIRLRVPDGAVSGNLEVRTRRGNSRPIYFEITGRPGIKTFRDKKTYTFSYSADIQIEKASLPNALYIWMPQPVLSASQRNLRLMSRNAEPFIENYRGASLFQFIDTQSRMNFNVSISYAAEVYTVETTIRNLPAVRLNRPSPIGTVGILPSPLIPADDPAIKAKSTAIIGSERLTYGRAQKIYDWITSSVHMEENSSGGAIEALEEQKADSFSASLLYCALARAASVPAQPVAGVIVNRQGKTIRHYWAEFWLDGFGWVPLDPALGGGLPIENFNLKEDSRRYYFGNMDNQRIAFSRGEHFLSLMTPRGQITRRNRDYSLQNIWEEAAGGIESYSSNWSDVTITGMYTQ